MDDAGVGCENEEGASARLKTICGSRAGSGGALGETDISRRLPSDEGGSTGDWTGASGGEYCVPTSTVTFAGAIADDDWVDVDQVRLCELVATAGERGAGRGNAAAGGVLMVGCGEVELRKRYDPL